MLSFASLARSVLYSRLKHDGRAAVTLAVATTISWVGGVVHNETEFLGATVLSPLNSIPGVILTLLYAVWLLSHFRRAVSGILFGWGLVGLIGWGIISVLPLSFLPWVPAQTVMHYLVHVVVSLANIPLILLSFRMLRTE